MSDGINLKFGTAGLRAIMKEGPDGLNRGTVELASKGLSNFLMKKFDKPKVIVSYDTRNNSRTFAEIALKVLKNSGVNAVMFGEPTPVPILSFAVRDGKYDAGIMITASHNPKEYNGYKVYNGTGGQILEEEADQIEKEIQSVKTVDDYNSETLTFADPSVYDRYDEAMNAASDYTDERNIKVIYTPLYGTGLKPVTRMLEKNGFRYEVVKEQARPDGNFPTCPKPNPELAEVYEIAKSMAKGADVIIATDPDCDRTGVMIPDKKGGFRILSGNDIGKVISYFLCQRLGKGTIVCSLVSTPIIDKICGFYHVNVIRTPVGFKWIGDQIDKNKDFVFGFEESCGYLVGDYARDKDAVVGTKLVCELTAYYKAQNKSVIDVLNEIDEKFGVVLDKTFSIDITEEVKDKSVKIKNYEDGSRVIIRPSGTEPKIKYYISASSEDRIKELFEENVKCK